MIGEAQGGEYFGAGLRNGCRWRRGGFDAEVVLLCPTVCSSSAYLDTALIARSTLVDLQFLVQVQLKGKAEHKQGSARKRSGWIVEDEGEWRSNIFRWISTL